MKFLQDYMEAKRAELFKSTNTFFAFNDKQFNEGEKPGITYVNMGSGMYCDKNHVKELLSGLNKIYKDSIQQDISENGIDNIVLRELWNQEAFYTGDISDTVNKLKDYKISEEKIQDIFITSLETNPYVLSD